MNENLLKNIEKEKKEKNKLPLNVLNEINKKVFRNIIIAIIVISYFISINLGYFNIDKTIFITDLNVFAICTLAFTIVIFEKAYKKDSGELTINGIECLVISIITLGIPYALFYTNIIYKYLVFNIGLIFSFYYVIKSIIIYFREKKKYLKTLSDIKNIVKKENKDNNVEEEEINDKKQKNELNETEEAKEIDGVKEKLTTVKKKTTVKPKTTNLKEKKPAKETKTAKTQIKKKTTTTTANKTTKKVNKTVKEGDNK